MLFVLCFSIIGVNTVKWNVSVSGLTSYIIKHKAVKNNFFTFFWLLTTFLGSQISNMTSRESIERRRTACSCQVCHKSSFHPDLGSGLTPFLKLISQIMCKNNMWFVDGAQQVVELILRPAQKRRSHGDEVVVTAPGKADWKQKVYGKVRTVSVSSLLPTNSDLCTRLDTLTDFRC